VRAITTFFRVSVPSASTFFDVVSRVVLTLIVGREDESGFSASRGRLLLDRHLLFN
jgi:hypothetical protein